MSDDVLVGEDLVAGQALMDLAEAQGERDRRQRGDGEQVGGLRQGTGGGPAQTTAARDG